MGKPARKAVRAQRLNTPGPGIRLTILVRHRQQQGIHTHGNEAGSDIHSPFSVCRTLQSAHQREKKMQMINGQCPTQFPQGSVYPKSPFRPPSSAPAGGEVRRGCLSPKGEFRAGRLLEQRRAVIRVANDRGSQVAFFADFLGDARKSVGRRAETRPTIRQTWKAGPEGHRRSKLNTHPGPAYGSPCLYDAASPEVAAASGNPRPAMKRAPALR
jgi:hypothetical protein